MSCQRELGAIHHVHRHRQPSQPLSIRLFSCESPPWPVAGLRIHLNQQMEGLEGKNVREKGFNPRIIWV